VNNVNTVRITIVKVLSTIVEVFSTVKRY